MSKGKVERPKKLAKKLTDIRLRLRLTQAEMAEMLRLQGLKVYDGYIGVYETGTRMPGVLTLLAYAKIAGISTDDLIDDTKELPAKRFPKIASKN